MPDLLLYDDQLEQKMSPAQSTQTPITVSYRRSCARKLVLLDVISTPVPEDLTSLPCMLPGSQVVLYLTCQKLSASHVGDVELAAALSTLTCKDSSFPMPVIGGHCTGRSTILFLAPVLCKQILAGKLA